MKQRSSRSLPIPVESDIHDLIKEVNIHGVDLNSKLEVQPGLKDIVKCRQAIEAARKYDE